MADLLPPQTSLMNTKLLSILVANIIPVIGLVMFDTSATALLVFYWLELGVLVIWAVVRALFAGHRPDQTGGLEDLAGASGAAARILFSKTEGSDSSSSGSSILQKRFVIPRTNVGVYVGTVPALFFIIPLLASVWIGFGGFVAGPVVAASNSTTTSAWVVTGTSVVFLTEGAQTVLEYFYRGKHRETSAWMAAKGIFWQGFALSGAGLLIVLLAYESTEGSATSIESAARDPLIFTAIASKFLIDLVSYYLDCRDQPLREAL